jgi:hypothetical protein
MTNRPARITQAEIQRVIRAARSREAALAAELEAIRTGKPLYNIVGKVAA